MQQHFEEHCLTETEMLKYYKNSNLNRSYNINHLRDLGWPELRYYTEVENAEERDELYTQKPAPKG
jgi:hypothetical protein